jgi:hypothetical protein
VAVEAQQVAAFVFDALKADAGAGGVNTLLGGRIYRDQVPAAATLPAATVGVVSSTDWGTLGAVRVLDVVLIDVRVVGAGASYGPINPAADRIDAVLQNRTGTSGGVWIVELRRDQTQLFLENDAGAQFAHCIQTYRTEAHALP